MSLSLVVVGTSAGGLRALEVVLSGLPSTFPLPVVIAQHRSKESTEAYPAVVGAVSRLRVREAEHDEPLVAGVVYVGPPDYHVLVEPGRVVLSVDLPVVYSRPSIDVLFESAADAYGRGVCALLLTGANSDGAEGLAYVKFKGGLALVQDPESAESRTMPAAGLASTEVDAILSLGAIAPELVKRSISS